MRFIEEFISRLEKGRTRVTTSADKNGNITVSFTGEGEYSSLFTLPVHLVLFGGGHIARALAELARLNHMEVTVVDDRSEVLTKEFFPHASELILSDFSSLPAERLSKIANPYFCIFTHGHSHDSECLEYCLRQQSDYTGMIGSKRKIESCFSYVIEHGIDESLVKKVHSPIGLSINAVTPEEIAVSIMAEIISVYRSEKNVTVVDKAFLEEVRNSEDGVLCRIIASEGSSPGKNGAMMLVREGKITGTVGGGALEEDVIRTAVSCTKATIKHYNLTGAGTLGMTCGGEVSVLFTPQA